MLLGAYRLLCLGAKLGVLNAVLEGEVLKSELTILNLERHILLAFFMVKLCDPFSST